MKKSQLAKIGAFGRFLRNGQAGEKTDFREKLFLRNSQADEKCDADF